MIFQKAYNGDQLVYRAYRNGKLIWDFGAHAGGIHIESALKLLMPRVEDAVTIQLHNNNLFSCTGDVDINTINPVDSYSHICTNNIFEWHVANTIHRLFAKTISPISIGEIASYGVVFSSGEYRIYYLRHAAEPHHADTVFSGLYCIESANNLCASLHNSDAVDFDKLLLHDTFVAQAETCAKDTVVSLASKSFNDSLYFSPKVHEVADVAMGELSCCTSRGIPAILNVYTVTFVCDGEAKHIERVIDGNDCADPVNREIAIPQRAATAQYTYKYAGWSLEDDDIVDENALEKITKDTTIYAAFDATIRCYTARFWVDDALEDSQEVAYGDVAIPPELTKEGYVLTWSPSDLTITGDTDFYGTWVRDYILPEQTLSFAHNSTYGVHTASADLLKEIITGQKYVVQWGENAWVCECKSITYSLNNVYIPTVEMKKSLGNAKTLTTIFGVNATTNEPDTKEPFLLVANNKSITLYTKSDDPARSVSIYKL